MDQEAITLVLDIAHAVERVSQPVVKAWATHCNFPMNFQGAMRPLRSTRVGTGERTCRSRHVRNSWSGHAMAKVAHLGIGPQEV